MDLRGFSSSSKQARKSSHSSAPVAFQAPTCNPSAVFPLAETDFLAESGVSVRACYISPWILIGSHYCQKRFMQQTWG